jgi:3-isopropylmalate dehydrogenase
MNLPVVFLGGDGIGPEVLDEARRVLETVVDRRHKFQSVTGLIGGAAIREHGSPLPDQTLELCHKAKAVLLGAVGSPEFDHLSPAQRPERGLLDLRKSLGNYANLRAVAVPDALLDTSPIRREVVQGTDLLIVRELLGGIYFGTPRGRTEQGAYDTETYSVEEITRVARTAFTLARQRRKRVVSVDKANVLETSALWREVCTRIAGEYSDVEFRSMYVDNCAMQLLLQPQQFDVILTNNMFGDILSDEAAMLAGSLGLLPSASIGGKVGLYEPVHGSAPDIAGKGLANPIGAILSVAMMLDLSFGLQQAAARIERAVLRALREGYRTPDIKSRNPRVKSREKIVSTKEMGEAICAFIRMPDAT